jgi:hypothetical protein
VRDAEQELHVDLGGRIAHVWLPSDAVRVFTLDLLGPGLTLFTGPDQAPWEAAAGVASPLPVVVRRLDPTTARALGIRGGGALLARPDGSPAGLWTHGADAVPALRAAVRSVLAGGRVRAIGASTPPDGTARRSAGGARRRPRRRDPRIAAGARGRPNARAVRALHVATDCLD